METELNLKRNNMAFKMKGHTLPGINQRSETKNLAEGRSPSSAFQAEGSVQEKDEEKRATDVVVDPDTKEVIDVATNRLIKAGAPEKVIEASRQRFIQRTKKEKGI